jgi:hypothetical protein
VAFGIAEYAKELECETASGNMEKILISYGNFTTCRQTGTQGDAGGFGAA